MYRGTNCFFTESQYTDIPVISPIPNVNWVRYTNKWYHCNDHIIKDYPLLTSSKEVLLLFYIKTD